MVAMLFPIISDDSVAWRRRSRREIDRGPLVAPPGYA